MKDLTEGVGLDIVLRLQDAHNPFFDALARILHFTGGTTFYLIVIPLVFWSIDRRLGLRMLFALIISGVAIVWLKEIFQQPRPYQVAPDKINKLFDQSGYGFPSGHVMQGILIWGMVVLYLDKRRTLWGVGVLAILTAWSRMYGGVHYPQDVIGGFIVGALLLWIFEPLYTSLTQIASHMPLRANLASIIYDWIRDLHFLLRRSLRRRHCGHHVGRGIWIDCGRTLFSVHDPHESHPSHFVLCRRNHPHQHNL
jgi:membrane-associated phospholipid phosphatase